METQGTKDKNEERERESGVRVSGQEKGQARQLAHHPRDTNAKSAQNLVPGLAQLGFILPAARHLGGAGWDARSSLGSVRRGRLAVV